MRDVPADKGARLAVVGSDTAPLTEADTAMRRAIDAARAALAANTWKGPRAADAKRIAAARAAADHLARVFNDPALVNLLAALAMDEAIHAECGRGGGASVDDDLPF
jgi:hypothetical protein